MNQEEFESAIVQGHYSTRPVQTAAQQLLKLGAEIDSADFMDKKNPVQGHAGADASSLEQGLKAVIARKGKKDFDDSVPKKPVSFKPESYEMPTFTPTAGDPQIRNPNVKPEMKKAAFFRIKGKEPTYIPLRADRISKPEWEREIGHERRKHFTNFLAMAEQKKGTPLTEAEVDKLISVYSSATGAKIPPTKDWTHGHMPYDSFEKSAAQGYDPGKELFVNRAGRRGGRVGTMLGTGGGSIVGSLTGVAMGHVLRRPTIGGVIGTGIGALTGAAMGRQLGRDVAEGRAGRLSSSQRGATIRFELMRDRYARGKLPKKRYQNEMARFMKSQGRDSSGRPFEKTSAPAEVTIRAPKLSRAPRTLLRLLKRGEDVRGAQEMFAKLAAEGQLRTLEGWNR